MKHSKIFTVMVLVILVSVALWSKGQQETQRTDGKIVLKIYTQYSDDTEKFPYDYAKAALKEYMPNVELELDIQGQDDDMRLKTYAAAGNLPDIINVNKSLIPQLVEHGDLALLNDEVARVGLMDKVALAAKSAFYFTDGNMYAIPKGTQYASGVFYNTKLFTDNGLKVPINFEEFLAAIAFFSAKDIIPLSLFAKEAWPGVQLYDMLLTRELPGGLIALDAGEVSISDPAFYRAAVKLEQLVKAGMLARGAFNTSYDEAFTLFTEGKAAMFLNGLWCVKDLGEAMGDNVAIMPDYFPFADKGKEAQSRWQMSGGTIDIGGFAVSKKSKHLEEAKKAAVFLSHKFAEGSTVKLGTPALFSDSPETEVELTTIHKQILDDAQYYKTTSGFPWSIANLDSRAAIEDAVNKVLARGYGAEGFIKDLKSKL
ncbi:MAG: extracellular solute-binding protein [Sphaerochaeta sp.]|nr:extracellular solute-binding protein [Sphaerochaeta sp.]